MSEGPAVRRLTVERLDRDAFEPFGAVVAPETGDSPRLNRAPGNLGFLWVQKALEFPKQAYMCSLRYYHRGNRCEFVQKHPASTVTMIVLGMAPAVFIVAPDAGGERPDVDAARAFLLTGGTGVVLDRGVWVRYAYPVGEYADFAYVTQRVDPATANVSDDVVRCNLDTELGFVFDFDLSPPDGPGYEHGPSGAITAGPPQESAMAVTSDQTTNDQPTNGQPTNGQPTNGQPTNGQPTNGLPTNGQPTNGQPILELRGISRRFGHVQALDSVDLHLRHGEILGVVGDNGAGKTTLMKTIAGTVKPDSGTISVDGDEVEITNAQDARRLGIEMIYQDLALFDNLDVAANVFIGREPTKGLPSLLGFLERRRMHREATELLQRLNIKIDSTKLPVGVLSGGQRQMVAISRAVAFEAACRILLMDEPSAALGAVESETVLQVIRDVRSHGLSIMIISHRIPEVLGLADRVAVMKNGELVDVLDTATTTVEECVNLIVAGTAARAGAEA